MKNRAIIRFYTSLITGLLLLISFSHSSAQEYGLPFVKNYSRLEYEAHPQNWAAVQDKSGLMYFGNNDGILEYDGTNWSLIKTGAVMSMDAAQNGTVYIGSVSDFGILAADSSGRSIYTSLLPFFKHEISNFPDFYDVWKTHATDKGVYFQSNEALFRFRDGECSVWYPTSSDQEFPEFHFSFEVNNKIYIEESGVGLLVMENDSLVRVPGGEFFAHSPIYTVLPFDKDNLLIGTKTEGLFLLSKNGDVRPFLTEADTFLGENQLYHGISLENMDGRDAKGFAFATLRGGVIILDRKGSLIQKLNRESRLQDEAHYLYTDAQDGLWVCSNNGLSRVEMPAPLSKWGEESGLRGSIEAVNRFKGRLFAASSLGIYYLEGRQFLQVKGINTQCWSLLKVKSQKGEHLLTATNDGVFELLADQNGVYFGKKIAEHNSYELYASKVFPNTVFVGLADGMAVLSYLDGKWKDFGRVENISGDINSMAEDRDGFLWACTRFEGIFKLSLIYANNRFSLKTYEAVGNQEQFTFAGRPVRKEDLMGNEVGILDDEPLFSGKAGIFKIGTKEFYVPGSISKFYLPNEQDIERFAKDEKGNIWIDIFKESSRIEILRKQEDGKYVLDSASLKRLPLTSINCLSSDSEDITWIGCVDGLYRFNDKIKKNTGAEYNVLIRKVSCGEGEIIHNGLFTEIGADSIPRIVSSQSERSVPKIDYSKNSIVIHYSSASYDNEAANVYRYILEGYDQNPSDWVRDTKKEYTNLPPGEYVFRLTAKNVYGTVSREATYRFVINSPFYRTKTAISLYILIGLGIIWLAVYFNSKRLRRQNDILEQVVQERTREIKDKSVILMHQKEEISAQRDLLEGKNSEIVSERDKTRQAYKNIQLLSEIGKKITAKLSADGIREVVYANVNDLMDASVFAVGIYNEELRKIEFRNLLEDGEMTDLTISIDDRNSLSALCLRNKEVVVISDFFTEYKRYIHKLPLTHQQKDKTPQSLIYLPLLLQERTVGVVTVQSYRTNAYSEHQVDLLKSLAVYIAIAMQNAEAFDKISQQKEIIEDKNQKIIRSNQNILDSITYASRIQSALLPDTAGLEKSIGEHFILMQPRESVSGDFYWFSDLEKDGRKLSVLAAVDCTGHGVPGAFMSLIGIDLLNMIVNQSGITDAEKILFELNQGVIRLLKQRENDNRDGMDLALCVIDKENKMLEFAGANNPLFYIDENGLQEIKGDRAPIGMTLKELGVRQYTRNQIPIDRPMSCFIFSDGYRDQFGGPEGRKFMKGQFKNLLTEIAHWTPDAQHRHLKSVLQKWRQPIAGGPTYSQTDDILIIGFKLGE